MNASSAKTTALCSGPTGQTTSRSLTRQDLQGFDMLESSLDEVARHPPKVKTDAML